MSYLSVFLSVWSAVRSPRANPFVLAVAFAALLRFLVGFPAVRAMLAGRTLLASNDEGRLACLLDIHPGTLALLGHATLVGSYVWIVRAIVRRQRRLGLLAAAGLVTGGLLYALLVVVAVVEVRVVLVGEGIDHAASFHVGASGDVACSLGDAQVAVVASASHGQSYRRLAQSA